MTEEGHFVNR